MEVEKPALTEEGSYLSGTVSEPPTSGKQFYAMAPHVPGVLVLPELAWAEAEEMYYCCSMCGELLAVMTPHGDFRAALFLGPIAGMFRVVWTSSTHRGGDPTQLYCIEGIGDRDQFKLIYDELGFRGPGIRADLARITLKR